MHASSPWSDLPSELLVSILRSLDFGSIVRCMAICTSWNFVINQNRHILLSARKDWPPWMLYPDRDQNYKLFDLSTNRMYHHRIESLAIDGQCAASSDDGWLVIVESSDKMQLLNPLTRAHIQIPSNVKHVFVDSTGSITSKNLTIKRFPEFAFCRSPYSSSGYLLVGLFDLGNGDHLAILSEGDDAWNMVEGTLEEPTCDLTFYKGKIYVITRWMQLYIWNLTKDSSLIFINKVEPMTIKKHYFKMKYLAISSDELLAVAKDQVCEYDKSVEVYKYDFVGSKWIRIMSLGDKVALFSCGNGHKSLINCDLYGFSENNIYFPWCSRLTYGMNNCSCNMQKFNLEDGRFNDYEPFLISPAWRPRPICFTPSLL